MKPNVWKEGEKYYVQRCAACLKEKYAPWNYRVLKTKDGEDDWYQIHEVYYDKDGKVEGWTKNGAIVAGNTLDEVRDSLERMLKALDKEILNQNKDE